jgi:hypothetical protein
MSQLIELNESDLHMLRGSLPDETVQSIWAVLDRFENLTIRAHRRFTGDKFPYVELGCFVRWGNDPIDISKVLWEAYEQGLGKGIVEGDNIYFPDLKVSQAFIDETYGKHMDAIMGYQDDE